MNIVIGAAFLLVALGLLGGSHYYVWRRTVRDTTARGGWPRRVGTVLCVVLPLVSFSALSARRGVPIELERALSWPGYMWLPVLLYLVLGLLVGEVVRPLLLRVLRRRAQRAAGSGNAEGAGAETAPAARVPVPVGASADDPAPAGTAAPEGAPSRNGTPARDGAAPDGAALPDGGAGAAPQAAPQTAPQTAEVSRRLFVSRTVAVAAGAVAVATVGHGTRTVFRGPTVKRITVPLAKLAPRDAGFRIAVVSDIHISPLLGRAHTQRIVDAVNGTQPDLVAIVGDLVDGSVQNLGRDAEPLAQLRARHGSYFVTGNHEYFGDAGEWVDFVRELGVHPLENARVEMPGFDLAGVNDVSAEGTADAPDYGAALGDRDTSRASVLLAHQPVMIHEAVKHGVDLQLSGHTHGGQLWPGNLIAGLANPTVAGLERYGDTQLYVSRGAGAWGPPVRVGAPSDITVVELASLRA
ncbi:metallophosphoesterase [Streptomyces sp. NPDC059506]|uniref:metallophosphoesterase n=1 Tax=unclassified Streptomyces TaxID=2593676 RepID=UPI002174DF06|nr:metallophosphoesterase [Streptomyces sp. SCUT-3]